MEPVEIKILSYVFRFRQLSWREEASIRPDREEDRLRAVLSRAMTEVSGLSVSSPEDAMKVLRAVPASVVQRMFVVYKGSLPMPRRFATTGLYRAPAPGNFVKRVEEVEQRREETMDRVERELEAKFGRREILETLEAERRMAKNSKLRGATKATPDEGALGATPPPRPRGGKGRKDAN